MLWKETIARLWNVCCTIRGKLIYSPKPTKNGAYFIPQPKWSQCLGRHAVCCRLSFGTPHERPDCFAHRCSERLWGLRPKTSDLRRQSQHRKQRIRMVTIT